MLFFFNFFLLDGEIEGYTLAAKMVIQGNPPKVLHIFYFSCKANARRTVLS